MNWPILFVAGLFEAAWAIGLKYTDGFTRLWPSVATVAAMVVSVVLLGIAMKTLPPDAKQRGAAEREKKGVLAADALSLALPCLANVANARLPRRANSRQAASWGDNLK